MPNFQSGILYANSGDVYTQLMDVIKTYIEARGWTSNAYVNYAFAYSGDAYVGKRLHAQKTIDSIDRFINLRSIKNQRIFEDSNNELVTGIGIVGSTGFGGATTDTALTSVVNSGGFARFVSTGIYATVGDIVTVSGTGVGEYDTTHTVTGVAIPSHVETSTPYVSNATGTITWPSRWGKMPGYTQRTSSDSRSQGAGAIDLPVDVLSYFLFSENNGDNIYMICGNSSGYSAIAFGVTSTGNYFVSGTPTIIPSNGADIYTNMFFTTITTAGVVGSLALRRKDDADWYTWPAFVGSAIAVSMRQVNLSVSRNDSPAEQLLYCSPDNFKGNNPLIPLYMGIKTFTNKIISAGVVPGIKYVNMKFMPSLTELTFGGDVYKLFRLYTVDDINDATVGLAFLK